MAGSTRKSFYSFEKLACQEATKFIDFTDNLSDMDLFLYFNMACQTGCFDLAKHIIVNNKLNVEQVYPATIRGVTYNSVSPLWLAAAAGELNILKLLLRHNAFINRATEEYSTPLWIACHGGHFEVAKYLIQRGADLEATNPFGCTSLMISCSKGYSALVIHLIKCGADVNRQTINGNTALHKSAKYGHLKIVKFLLESGAEIYCSSDGLTPLLYAAVSGQQEVIDFLIQKSCCSKLDKINALELLGANRVAHEVHKRTALALWRQALKMRFEDNDHPLEKPTTRSVLSSAIEFRSFAELDYISSLQPGTSFWTEMGLQAVLIAERVLGPTHLYTFRYVDLKCIHFLIDQDYDRGIQILMRCLDAHQQKHLQPLRQTENVLKSFISEIHRYFLNDPVRFKGIIFCVFEKSVLEIKSLMEWLKKNGENTNNTFQFHSLLLITLELMGLVSGLEMDANEELQFKKTIYQLVHMDPRGLFCRTILHLAFSDFYYAGKPFPTSAIIDLLLEVGASPNVVDLSNNTPLHIVAEKRPFDQTIFKSFLKYGAHLDFCNDKRQTAVQLAKDFLPNIDHLQFVNLQCLSARVIRLHNIPYEGVIGERLEEFLNRH